MISLPLFKREMKANSKLLMIFIYILTLYILSMIYLYDPEKNNIMEQMVQAMPEVMKAFGMVSSGGSLISFLSSYLYGFIILMFPIIFIIILANKLVASYMDRGSMAYLLATPNKRIKIIFTQALCLWVNMAILIAYATVAIIVISAFFHPGALDVKKLIEINFSVFMLHLAVSGICFFASSISNDTKLSFTIGAGIPVIFYLIQMIANMGGKLENLKYFTLYTLFNTNDIISGKNILLPVIVLTTISIILYSISIFIFSKRDLPV